MNILLFSDSHHKTENLAQVLTTLASSVDLVIHLGDNLPDLLKFQPKYPDLEMFAVPGNCDFTRDAQEFLVPTPIPMLLLHGHTRGVKSGYDRLCYFAKERGAKACFFGHTHAADIFERDGIFFMNPGSIGDPRGDDLASYGLVQISAEGKVSGRIVEI